MIYKIQFLRKISLKNLHSYIQTVNSLKILSFKEEKKLAQKIYYNSDFMAARDIILSNLRFVVHIARNYSGYGLPQSDLIQEGNIGLMKSVRRFNPNINVRVISFAVYWIKSAIHEYILKNWRIVKIATTKSHRKLFFNLRKNKKKLNWFNENEIYLVSQELGVTIHDVKQMESRMLLQDIAFCCDTNYNNITLLEKNVISCIKDYKSNFAIRCELENLDQYFIDKLNYALYNLDPISRYIIRSRWLNHKNKNTLQYIAKIYYLSSERIRQLEQIAIMKLKNIVDNN